MGICAPARPVYEGAEYIYQYEKSYAGKSERTVRGLDENALGHSGKTVPTKQPRNFGVEAKVCLFGATLTDRFLLHPLHRATGRPRTASQSRASTIR